MKWMKVKRFSLATFFLEWWASTPANVSSQLNPAVIWPQCVLPAIQNAKARKSWQNRCYFSFLDSYFIAGLGPWLCVLRTSAIPSPTAGHRLADHTRNQLASEHLGERRSLTVGGCRKLCVPLRNRVTLCIRVLPFTATFIAKKNVRKPPPLCPHQSNCINDIPTPTLWFQSP